MLPLLLPLRRRWPWFLLWLLPLCVLAQSTPEEGDPTWDEFVETFYLPYLVDEQQEEREFRLGLDALETLHHQPLDLNSATRTDLLALPFLAPAQVDSLLSYRERIGHFTSLGDLMLVHSLGFIERRWLSLFVQVL
ncbi:MAG: helix-hairpin-helix domain-containing protein, partial [Bacteroidaceae bacterium]|nr:helix-hairpin-helix domain-containing protein [Bacteroidaceae bacterium]